MIVSSLGVILRSHAKSRPFLAIHLIIATVCVAAAVANAFVMSADELNAVQVVRRQFRSVNFNSFHFNLCASVQFSLCFLRITIIAAPIHGFGQAQIHAQALNRMTVAQNPAQSGHCFDSAARPCHPRDLPRLIAEAPIEQRDLIVGMVAKRRHTFPGRQIPRSDITKVYAAKHQATQCPNDTVP